MFTSTFDSKLTKVEFYQELLIQLNLLLSGQRNWVTNLANVSSLIFYGLNSIDVFKENVINWVGFYVSNTENPNVLLLGPFQGKVACNLIKYGRGVCGTAAETKKTQIVTDIYSFPGHIACDSGSNSEIVVPILSPENNKVLAVLDIDSLSKGTFDEEDKIGLERICEAIAISCDW